MMLRFDGLYISKLPTDYGQNPSYNYLRFYNDGTAIEVTASGDRNTKIASWFNNGHPGVSKGGYKLHGTTIRFSLRSESGIVDYAGETMHDGLSLQWYSHINAASGFDEYEFFPVTSVEVLDTTTIDALILALEGADPDVCCSAAAQAGKDRVRPAVLALVRLLYMKGTASKRIVTAAARALGDIGDLRAIQHLEEAGYAHEYSGVTPGSIALTADGRTIEPDEEDVLMDEALREAEKKLWKQPGADPYLAQLGRIKMYNFSDFLKSNEILIDPGIQNRRQDPFTMDNAQQFFANFKRERFSFEGEIRSIFVRCGEQALGHGFAHGNLYSQNLDEIERLGDSALDHPVGDIHFELGGNTTPPYIAVRPEPKWPHPSIVRRCVLHVRTGIEFEDIA